MRLTDKLTGKQSDFLKIVVAAAGRGDLAGVRQLVEDRPEWVRTVGSHGRTMLWEAAYRGKLEVVKYLVEQGADLERCGCHYTSHMVEISPYCAARIAGRDDVATYLLSVGAQVDIHTAAFLGDKQRVALLLESDPDLLNQGHPQHDMGRGETAHLGFYLAPAPWATPLCYALQGGSIEVVEYLLERGAQVRGFERQLFRAARGDVHLLRLLLEHGADPAHAPRPMADETELCELLESYGVKPLDLNAPGQQWPRIIFYSRGDRGEHPERIERLIRLGADVNIRNYKQKTALHYAAKAGFIETMRTLLAHGAEVDATDRDGETPLFDAVRSTIRKRERKVEAVRMLLQAGANAEHVNRRGETPLVLARRARRPESEEIATLLERSVSEA